LGFTTDIQGVYGTLKPEYLYPIQAYLILYSVKNSMANYKTVTKIQQTLHEDTQVTTQ
jgi:hypothetical protein